LDNQSFLYICAAFFYHGILIFYFSLRKLRFNFAIRYGYIIYALGIPYAFISLIILIGGKEWYFWLGGFLYLVWGIFGYIAEYNLKIEWRDPILWKVFIPYIFLYLATTMFYWFPLAQVNKIYWYIAGVLFLFTTYLNTTSHHPQAN
jgi:hypothetical protein